MKTAILTYGKQGQARRPGPCQSVSTCDRVSARCESARRPQHRQTSAGSTPCRTRTALRRAERNAVSFPQAEQVVWVSTRSRATEPDVIRGRAWPCSPYIVSARLNCLSAKKSCSPAVQMNSAPQSTHLRDLSWNSIGRHLVLDHAGALFRFASELFSVPLPRQCLLGLTLITRLQIEGVLLDVLDDVFLLNLSLKPTEGALIDSPSCSLTSATP